MSDRAFAGAGDGLECRRDVDQTSSPVSDTKFVLRLYVAGRSSTGAAALRNVTRFCEVWLHGRYELRVVDVLKEPDLAAGDGVVATPTLVKYAPAPTAHVFGTLADEAALIAALAPDVRQGERLRSAGHPLGDGT